MGLQISISLTRSGTDEFDTIANSLTLSKKGGPRIAFWGTSLFTGSHAEISIYPCPLSPIIKNVTYPICGFTKDSETFQSLFKTQMKDPVKSFT